MILLDMNCMDMQLLRKVNVMFLELLSKLSFLKFLFYHVQKNT